jgi:transmembrane sensor
MEKHVNDQGTIDAEASEWVVRHNESPPSLRDDEAFQAWLAADPRHGQTYRALSRTWQDIGELKDLASLANAEAPLQSPAWRRFIHDGFFRRPLVAGTFAAAAMLLLLLFLPLPFNRPDARYNTAIAEIRSVTLADNSIVTLGARSEIDVEFSKHERAVTLRSGEAFFEVAPNAARPFLVNAGGTIIRVIGTKFDVHLGSERVRVSVLEGVVEVREARFGAPESKAMRTLRVGQRIEIPQNAPASTGAVERDPAPAAWRQGRLAYDDARLADVVADLNRYYTPGVELASVDVGELRVTASFRTTEIPAFLDALETALPVTLSRDRAGSIRVRTQVSAR